MTERPTGREQARVLPTDESRLERLRFKAAEYYDLFWFDVLGRLPLIGHRLSDFHSDRNFRRG